MTSVRIAMLARVSLGLLLAACGSKSAASKATCERAATRYVTCVREMLGPEAAALASSKEKDGVAECTRDITTVAMYDACLPTPTCTGFMACIENRAAASVPAIAADKPRAEQCAQHVRDGLRGIAMQVVMLGERSEADRRQAQNCLIDESRPLDTCITPDERAETQRYGVQRQTECEAWSADLAACVLKLPGAHDCKPDEEPLWRLPIEQGAAGPKVAWSVELATESKDDDEPTFEWTADLLVIRDREGLRAVRDGKEIWRVAADKLGTPRGFAIVGAIVTTLADTKARGLVMFDVATGKPRGSALAGTRIEAFGRVADRVVALTDSSGLFEIAPGSCAGKCAGKLRDLTEDEMSFAPRIGGTADTIAIVSNDGILGLDRRGKRRFWIDLDDDAGGEIAFGPDGVALADDKGVAALAFAGCAKQGASVYVPSTTFLDGGRTDREPPEDCEACPIARRECVTAGRVVSLIQWVAPVPVPGGGVAFNDHGIVEQTQLVSPATTWEVKTGGTGEVALDDRHVYTISMGLDGQGPARLLALARATGATVWQSDLPGAPAKLDAYSDARVAIRGTQIAARVGAKLFVLAQP